MRVRGFHPPVLCVLLAFWFPQLASAAVAGKTFYVGVASTVSGVLGGEGVFNPNGTYSFLATSETYYYGDYDETIDGTTNTSTITASVTDGDGYSGMFFAQATDSLFMGTTPVVMILGVGAGNAGDVFFFVGYALQSQGQ